MTGRKSRIDRRDPLNPHLSLAQWGRLEVFELRGDTVVAVWATGWDRNEDWGRGKDWGDNPEQIGFIGEKMLFVNNHTSLLLYQIP
jgi:hypothetical protein